MILKLGQNCGFNDVWWPTDNKGHLDPPPTKCKTKFVDEFILSLLKNVKLKVPMVGT